MHALGAVAALAGIEAALPAQRGPCWRCTGIVETLADAVRCMDF